MIRNILCAVVAAGALSACEKQIDAPMDTGVCWQAIPLKNGQIKFNKLSEHEPSLDSCAGSLEGMRLRFEAMGGAQEIMGAYQGQYLFLLKEGIFTSQTEKGDRYLAWVRTGDGRLARPGAMPVQ
jgi:hypothetical protein